MLCGMWMCFAEGYWVSSTLCRYEIRMGLLFGLSWARVRRVSLGRESSDGEILVTNCCMSLLWLRCRRCVYYAGVYLC